MPENSPSSTGLMSNQSCLYSETPKEVRPGDIIELIQQASNYADLDHIEHSLACMVRLAGARSSDDYDRMTQFLEDKGINNAIKYRISYLEDKAREARAYVLTTLQLQDLAKRGCLVPANEPHTPRKLVMEDMETAPIIPAVSALDTRKEHVA